VSLVARTTTTRCPTCKGAVARGEGTRAQRCPFCQRRSLVVTREREVMRYSLETSLDAAGAGLAARRGLAERRVTATRLLDLATFADPSLVFVPFLWTTGTTPALVRRDKAITERRSAVDTKVVIDDFEVFEPAVELEGWGLRALDVGALLARPRAPLPRPFDGTALRSRGRVLVPQHAFDEAASRRGAKLARTTIHGDDGGECLAERRRILWIPIWIVAFVVRGRRYEARVEGVDGTLLSARGPEDERWRVPMALGALLIPCLLVGKLLRFVIADASAAAVGASFLNPGFLLTVALAAAIALSVFLSILAFAWSLLRYEAEHVYRDGRVWSEQLGRGGTTILDRLTDRVGGAFTGLLGGSRS
jgi:hypothetical protein